MPVVCSHATSPGRATLFAGNQNWQRVVRTKIGVVSAGNTYVALCMGTLGAFSGPVSNGPSAQVAFVVTDANGTVTQASFSPVHEVCQFSPLLTLATGAGVPFFAVVQFTAAAGDAHLEIQAHAGAASSAIVSDAGIWTWNQTAFPGGTTFSTIASAPGPVFPYPTYTQMIGVSSPAYIASTDLFLVAWSSEVLWPDPSFGYHTRCRRLSDGVTLMGAAQQHGGAAEHAGIGQVGFASGFDRFTMGGFRVFQLGVGLGTHDDIVVEFARPKFTASGVSPVQPGKTSVFVTRIQSLDDRHGLHTTNLPSFIAASGPGTPAFMAFVPATPSGPSDFLLAGSAGLADTTSLAGSARLEASLNGNFARVGTSGLYARAFPGDSTFPGGGYVSPVPQQSILFDLPNPQLGNVTHVLSLVGSGNPNEFGEGTRRGYDVAHAVVSAGTQLILPAPVEISPGPDVYLAPGYEAPRLTAISEITVMASYVDDLELEFMPVGVRYDDGHAGGWPQRIVSDHHRRIHWDAVEWDDWDTLIRPILESTTGAAWQLRVSGESSPRVFRTRGALTQRAVVAPGPVVGVWSVTVDAVEMILVGP